MEPGMGLALYHVELAIAGDVAIKRRDADMLLRFIEAVQRLQCAWWPLRSAMGASFDSANAEKLQAMDDAIKALDPSAL